MSLQLSESLYPVDEVIGTFIQCLLMNSTTDECLFWLWELIYTTNNLCEGLVSIYQQFYGHTNSNIGIYITMKVYEYRATGNNRHLADIVCNIKSLTSTPVAYYIVKYSQMYDTPSIIYKHRKWMVSYPLTMCGLFGSIKAQDFKNIGVYVALSLRTNGFDHTKEALLIYANNIGKNIDTGLCNTLCDNDIITIACLIAKLVTSHASCPKNKFVRSKIDDVMKLEQHFSENSVRHYMKLAIKRTYSTHTLMPPLKYGRFSLSNDGFMDACRLHWEYYCFNSVEWNKRFNKYNTYLDHNIKQLLWSTYEDTEQFYTDGHCMEFDEQPIDVMEKSLHSIDVISDPADWYETIILKQLSQMTI